MEINKSTVIEIGDMKNSRKNSHVELRYLEQPPPRALLKILLIFNFAQLVEIRNFPQLIGKFGFGVNWEKVN